MLSRGVVLIGLTSLLTDVSSEMIYPILPIFLTSVIGASTLSVGLLEGAAESISSLTKLASGALSDRMRNRKAFALAGYAVANTARPLIGLAGALPHVFALRFTDRIGKGIRGAPRDAWLAELATPETRGAVFGFHRAMDHLGATLGPLLATAYLSLRPGEYRELFLLTLIPGWLAVATLSAVPEERAAAAGPVRIEPSAPSGPLPSRFKRFLAVLAVFTLGNSTDAFLLLKLQGAGVPDTWLPAAWSALHLVKTAASPLGGRISDRIGRARAIGAGWLWYAAIYLTLARASDVAAVLAAFLAYGLFFGLTEGPQKAWIADLVPAASRGKAFGTYHLIIGLGALPSSILFGWVWQRFGSSAAFAMGSALALVASLGLLAITRPVTQKTASSPATTPETGSPGP